LAAAFFFGAGFLALALDLAAMMLSFFFWFARRQDVSFPAGGCFMLVGQRIVNNFAKRNCSFSGFFCRRADGFFFGRAIAFNSGRIFFHVIQQPWP
jgi:hypothetical protein